MNEEKEVWYQSKTVWASLVVMVIGLMQSLNLGEVGPVSIDAMTAEKETLVESLSQLGVLAGCLSYSCRSSTDPIPSRRGRAQNTLCERCHRPQLFRLRLPKCYRCRKFPEILR